MTTTPNNSTFDLERYRLLDHGNGRKLEAFGGVLLDRPAPQSEGRPAAPELWKGTHAVFTRDESGGHWTRLKHFDDPWRITIGTLTFELTLSPQGQVGLFPEQAPNWGWIADVIALADRDTAILNTFGYTGGATLAALTAPTPHRVEGCHVDGSKSAVARARRNAAQNGKTDVPIRWIVDDVMTFLRREVKRNRRYDGIILDPPAFGHGPDGKRWKLTDDLPRLLELTGTLLNDRPLFVLFSCHDPLLNATAIRRELKRAFGGSIRSVEIVSLELACAEGAALPAGLTGRILF